MSLCINGDSFCIFSFSNYPSIIERRPARLPSAGGDAKVQSFFLYSFGNQSALSKTNSFVHLLFRATLVHEFEYLELCFGLVLLDIVRVQVLEDYLVHG